MKRLSGYLRDLICISEFHQLKDDTMLHNSGLARYYAEPRDLNECTEVLENAYKKGLEVKVIGSGTHTLISDNGFEGLLLSTKSMNGITLKGNLITAYAGETLDNIINKSINHHLIGLEQLAGIPGTLGGALKVNAAANGAKLSDFIFYIDYLKKDGSFNRTPVYSETFGHNGITLPEDSIFIAAGLRMTPSSSTAEARLRKEMFTELMLVPPIGRMLADVFYDTEDHKAADIIKELRMQGESGLKAEFSDYNANMILTYESCKAEEVKILINRAIVKAKETLGITLKPSVSIIGKFS